MTRHDVSSDCRDVGQGGNPSAQTRPLYRRIKDALREQIREGALKPYQQLPSESELMARYGVSRITVRQALRDLHSEGLIFSIQGKGSFVAAPKVVQELKWLQGFAEAMALKGFQAWSKVLLTREPHPDRDVARALGLKRTDRVVEIQRVRYLGREPVSLDVSFFPAEVGRLLLEADITGDLFPLLETRCGLRLGTADLRIEAVACPAGAAMLLSVTPGAPVLQIHRLTRTAEGMAVDFERLYYRGDVCQYQVQLHRRR